MRPRKHLVLGCGSVHSEEVLLSLRPITNLLGSLVVVGCPQVSDPISLVIPLD